MSPYLLALVVFLALLVVYDLLQRKHAILRNFPVIGHLRYILEAVGPELRQYIVTNNDEERPFSRDQRTWVYASAKQQNNYFGFGTDNKIELAPHYLIIKHSAFPLNDPHKSEPGYDPEYRVPCGKILGGWRGRAKAFRPQSVVNISAMSYGSLSAPAVKALNQGCGLAGCLHNTGEGGVAPHHRHGGDLIWQIGTGYFGCRAKDGGFDRAAFLETVAATPTIRAIEIKLSQGAKPGLGGVLPKAKITPEIAEIRRIERGSDCISPSSHSAFSDVPSLVNFVEDLAEQTGLPVGIKSAVGDLDFWRDLARHMAETGRGVDFIALDGGEGGTGAAPLTFSDHVSLPFKVGFTRVYKIFAEAELHEKIVFIGSGKLGFPETALLAFGLGADMVAVAREAMLAIGCIQAQRCQTGHCPTGVATQNRWLMRGLDPTSKAARLANYVRTLRKELLRLSRACGVPHPTLVTSNHIEILDDRFGAQPARDLFGYEPHWGHPSGTDCECLPELMATLGQGQDALKRQEV
ncbi:MAG: FMN-binding glutamate synthase family protein [Acidobacteriota bacterium]